MNGYVDVRAYAELNDFLPPASRGVAVRRPVAPHQTVKDVIEALGVPHTEVDLVVVNGEPVDFAYRPRVGDCIAVYPVFEALDIAPIAQLRPAPLRHPRFVVDVHLGRLARALRLLGFDTRWGSDLDDATLAAISHSEQRILLTRDRGLLKRRAITHGVWIRSEGPVEQAVEVVRRLNLEARMAPFTRCLRCNGTLIATSKAEVLDRLKPLTRRYYEDFCRCSECGHVFWRGSHHSRLAAFVEQIRGAVGAR